MPKTSQPQADSSTRSLYEMELFVRERRPGERDFKIAYRIGPNASAGVAEVYGSNMGISPDVARALAHLLAAAPALLKALERALTTTQEIERVSGQRHFNPGTLQEMADAIAQAKGQRAEDVDKVLIEQEALAAEGEEAQEAQERAEHDRDETQAAEARYEEGPQS